MCRCIVKTRCIDVYTKLDVYRQTYYILDVYTKLDVCRQTYDILDVYTKLDVWSYVHIFVYTRCVQKTRCVDVY